MCVVCDYLKLNFFLLHTERCAFHWVTLSNIISSGTHASIPKRLPHFVQARIRLGGSLRVTTDEKMRYLPGLGELIGALIDFMRLVPQFTEVIRKRILFHVSVFRRNCHTAEWLTTNDNNTSSSPKRIADFQTSNSLIWRTVANLEFLSALQSCVRKCNHRVE